MGAVFLLPGYVINSAAFNFPGNYLQFSAGANFIYCKNILTAAARE